MRPTLLFALPLLVAGCGAPSEGRSTESRDLPATEVNWENDVAVETLKGSVHAELDCTDCHSKNEGSEDKRISGDLQCRGCHDKAEKVYDESAHGRARNAGDPAARCQDCHGAHDVYAVDDARSRTSKRRLAATCSKCHDSPLFQSALGKVEPNRVRHYYESIHGQLLVKKGTVVAPSCVDCHGGHEVAKRDDPASRVHPRNISATCGSCHEGITRKYATSVHGKALDEGAEKAPTCISCHSAHAISSSAASFKLESDKACGKCHEERLAQHLGTYHGRAHALGGTRVAACYDCHGSHETLASKDPASNLAPAERVETCKKCHENAAPGFAGYFAHGNSGDRKAYPLLYWTERPVRLLIYTALGLAGLHALVVLLRSLFAFLYAPAEYRLTELARGRRLLAVQWERFRSVDRFAFTLLLIAFALLVATGMPLKFHTSGAAQAVFALLGGADVARALHKLGASMTFVAVFVHLTSLVWPVWRDRGLYADETGSFRLRKAFAHLFGAASPLPSGADLRELAAHVRWVLGRGPTLPPRRFRYWEKLDYLALTATLVVVLASGLTLWAPELVTRVLPGWWLNVAHTLHSEEALLTVAGVAIIYTLHRLPKLLTRDRAPAPRRPLIQDGSARMSSSA